MQRLSRALVLLWLPLAGCHRGPATDPNRIGDPTADHSATYEQNRREGAQRLVGKWLKDPETPLPKGYSYGYEFKADGTFSTIPGPDGQGQQSATGSWKLTQNSGKGSGGIELTGAAAPYPVVSFELVNDDSILTLWKQDGAGPGDTAWFRRPK